MSSKFWQLTASTPKMKKKTGGGQMALAQGDCQWLIFTGRNYKVGLQLFKLTSDWPEFWTDSCVLRVLYQKMQCCWVMGNHNVTLQAFTNAYANENGASMFSGNVSEALPAWANKTRKGAICKSLFVIFSFSSQVPPSQVKLLCPKVGSEFVRAGSSGVSLLAGLAIILVAASLASLGLVWKRLRRRKGVDVDFEEGREEAEELHSCEVLEREQGLSEDWTLHWPLLVQSSYYMWYKNKTAYLNSLQHLSIWFSSWQLPLQRNWHKIQLLLIKLQTDCTFSIFSDADTLRPTIKRASA